MLEGRNTLFFMGNLAKECSDLLKRPVEFFQFTFPDNHYLPAELGKLLLLSRVTFLVGGNFGGPIVLL